jgi:PAS domain-containing protein
MANLMGDVGIPIQSIIDRFPFPILVVDEDVTVSVLNKRGQEILGIPPNRVDRQRGGELFGCVNSHLPGGCGRTVHCSGCALRRAVTATYHTREPQVRVPATLKTGDPDSPAEVALTFSTSMRGSAVLVKIDRLDR